MLDIRRLRTETESVKRALARRGAGGLVEAVDEVLGVDERRRSMLAEVNELKAQRNEVSKKIGELKREGVDAADSIEEMKGVGERISELDGKVTQTDERIQELLLVTPNLPLEEVPEGGVENNVVVRTVGERRDEMPTRIRYHSRCAARRLPEPLRSILLSV